MVRNLTGTLVEVGSGRRGPSEMAALLAARDRRRAGRTAPAHGLTLEWVRYAVRRFRLTPAVAAFGIHSRFPQPRRKPPHGSAGPSRRPAARVPPTSCGAGTSSTPRTRCSVASPRASRRSCAASTGRPSRPHVDTGDFVIVVNAEKVKLTGRKLEQKVYYRHTGWTGHLRSTTAGKLLAGPHADRVMRARRARHAAEELARPADVPEAQGLRRARSIRTPRSSRRCCELG